MGEETTTEEKYEVVVRTFPYPVSSQGLSLHVYL